MKKKLPVLIMLFALLAGLLFFGRPKPEIPAEPVPSAPPITEPTAVPVTEPSTAPVTATVQEDGVYDTKDEVAEYIHIYGHLPSNYMTKKEARKRGWDGGALHLTIEGMCIGGDVFGNYEGILPEDHTYYECDIDTLTRKKRGEKRIVYSEDGLIFYTEDHYETFEQLYGDTGQ